MTGNRRKIELGKHEHVLTAFASPAKGPGWANWPMQVVIQEKGAGNMRVEWIQPQAMPVGLCALYGVSAAVQKELVAQVEAFCCVEKVK